MRTLVMKFGGASVSSPKKFSLIADLILDRTLVYQNIVVVVSAMGDATDKLFSLARQVHEEPPRRELDMLLSVGERISIALLAMALDKKGKRGVSLTGSQSGIITCNHHSDARILEVRPRRILENLSNGHIVIVAGFQGVSRQGEITTLGRGGSDTTAVALGVALQAEKVEFFKDVSGIYEKDPKKDSNATLFPSISYRDVLQILKGGAKVLHSRCVLLAEKNNLPLHVRSFEDRDLNQGTFIGDFPRTNYTSFQYEAEVEEVHAPL